jgi:hypothetical protein
VLYGLKQAHQKHDCVRVSRYVGDSKIDPDTNQPIYCTLKYFDWDEPNWLFGTRVRPLYTNWWDKKEWTDWSNQPLFFQASVKRMKAAEPHFSRSPSLLIPSASRLFAPYAFRSWLILFNGCICLVRDRMADILHIDVLWRFPPLQRPHSPFL